MPREPEVAAGSSGESPCCAGSPLGESMPGGGSPLAVPFELVRKARCWRRLTSSAAVAAAPSLSCRCSAYRYSNPVKDSGSMHASLSCCCPAYRSSYQVKDSCRMHAYGSQQMPLHRLLVLVHIAFPILQLCQLSISDCVVATAAGVAAAHDFSSCY